MRRLRRTLLGGALLVVGLAALGVKAWLTLSGPYLEVLPPYPYCEEAARALAADEVAEARELASAGGCPEVQAQADARWSRLSARAGRCASGIWSGRGEGADGLGCAVASDLVVFGDVRDLTRQGLRWRGGEETDPVLIALSTAGLTLTLVPQAGVGTSLLKAARRAGSLGDGLARRAVSLTRRRAWRPLGHLLGDAGRIGRKLGPEGVRALEHADTPAELTRLSRFVDAAPSPLLALRWGGKGVTRVNDPALYRTALARGPAGVALATERGAKALLSRKPLVVFGAKVLHVHREAVAAALVSLLRFATWPWVLLLGGGSLLLGTHLVRGDRGLARGAP